MKKRDRRKGGRVALFMYLTPDDAEMLAALGEIWGLASKRDVVVTALSEAMRHHKDAPR